MKAILTIEEMVEYTSVNKRIVHDNTSSSELFLLMNNYQNVVSVHKHNYHSGKDKNNRHIYNTDTNFKEYIRDFNSEREDYPLLRERACMFEFYFKNLVAYYFFQEYNNYCIKHNILCDEINILSFLESRKNHCHIENLKINHGKNINKVINNIIRGNTNGISPFVVFNGLHLTEIRFIFVTLNNNNRSKIVRELVDNKILNIPGTREQRLTNFERSLRRLIGIRNVVVHNNSLSIHKKIDQEKYSKGRKKNKNTEINKALAMYK